MDDNRSFSLRVFFLSWYNWDTCHLMGGYYFNKKRFLIVFLRIRESYVHAYGRVMFMFTDELVFARTRTNSCSQEHGIWPYIFTHFTYPIFLPIKTYLLFWAGKNQILDGISYVPTLGSHVLLLDFAWSFSNHFALASIFVLVAILPYGHFALVDVLF